MLFSAVHTPRVATNCMLKEQLLMTNGGHVSFTHLLKPVQKSQFFEALKNL